MADRVTFNCRPLLLAVQKYSQIWPSPRIQDPDHEKALTHICQETLLFLWPLQDYLSWLRFDCQRRQLLHLLSEVASVLSIDRELPAYKLVVDTIQALMC